MEKLKAYKAKMVEKYDEVKKEVKTKIDGEEDGIK